MLESALSSRSGGNRGGGRAMPCSRLHCVCLCDFAQILHSRSVSLDLRLPHCSHAMHTLPAAAPLPLPLPHNDGSRLLPSRSLASRSQP